MVAFFMWTAALCWILSLDNLMRKGLPQVNWCCMCQSIGESVDHLFFIVMFPILCRWTCLRYLGLIESCQTLLWVYCFFGGIGLRSRAQIFRTWFQVVWCGLYGRSGIFICLRTTKTHWINSNICARTVFDWSRYWGSSDCSSILDLLASLIPVIWLFVFMYSLFLCIHHPKLKVYILIDQ